MTQIFRDGEQRKEKNINIITAHGIKGIVTENQIGFRTEPKRRTL